MTLNVQSNPIYSLYICSSWNHENYYDKLRHLLSAAKDFQFTCHFFEIDGQIDGLLQNDRQLYETIRKKMKYCDIVILLCGVYPIYSKWLNKEIILSKNELHKPLLAIEILEGKKTSLIVKQNADRIVGWNIESIVDAIRELV
ncbi:MAG TPA: TIR domain-containing protein [Bacilli bacterium]